MKCIYCPKTYIRQTKRLVRARVREHPTESELAERQSGQHIRKSVAKHIMEEVHVMDEVEMLKEVKQAKLDPYESFLIDRKTQVTLLNAHSPLSMINLSR